MTFQTITTSLLMVVFLLHPSITAAISDRETDEQLRSHPASVFMGGGHSPSPSPSRPEHPVVRFYREMGHLPVWFGSDGPLPHGEALLEVVVKASEAGLFPDDYRFFDAETAAIDDTRGWDRLLPLVPAPHVKRDLLLTHALLQYAQHLAHGRIDPERLGGQWLAQRRPERSDIPVELAQALKGNRLAAYIETLHPTGEAYQALRRVLQRYEQIRRSGGWATIPPGPTLAIGDRGARVETMRDRLEMTGDACGAAAEERDRFDDRLEAAVKHFQQRHGLQADGKVGRRTLAELNVPVELRISQLQLNMERWRWLPESFGDRHIVVNIPAYALSIVDSAEHRETIRVIVGKRERPTPIMTGRMTYLEFNPYWNIPPTIARRDILPKVLSDPDYLTRQGIRIYDGWDRLAREVDPTGIAWQKLSPGRFPYRLRQDPSDWNALGQVKFMFPNPHSIYIHDTPGKTLFERQERFLSSGCVRVEEPVTLAHYLLSAQGWDRDRVEAAIARGERKSVILDRPIPVHLVYFTAFVDADQTVQFREDIYGWDERLRRALHHSAPERFVDGNPQSDNARLLAALADPPNGPLSPPPDGATAAQALPAEFPDKR